MNLYRKYKILFIVFDLPFSLLIARYLATGSVYRITLSRFENGIVAPDHGVKPVENMLPLLSHNSPVLFQFSSSRSFCLSLIYMLLNSPSSLSFYPSSPLPPFPPFFFLSSANPFSKAPRPIRLQCDFLIVR